MQAFDIIEKHECYNWRSTEPIDFPLLSYMAFRGGPSRLFLSVDHMMQFHLDYRGWLKDPEPGRVAIGCEIPRQEEPR